MSNSEPKDTNGAASWTLYEMEPFGHSSGSADKPEATFVSLQNNEKRRKGDFIPLARAGDGFEEQDKAAEIVRKAHEKAARIEQEAYEKGFNQGEKDGLELGEKKASKMTEHIEELLQGLIRLRGELVKHHEQDIIKLIFAIAKRIIKQTTKMNEDAVREVLFKAVNLATEKSEVTIRINPEDFDLVERLRPEFFAAFNDLKSVTVASDPSITQGGCLLETSSGEIDARIETQLERIYQSLEAAGDFET